MLLAVSLAAACRTEPEPSAELPDVNYLLGESYVRDDGLSSVAAGTASPRWWEQFGDPVTDRLVEDALKHNFDLRAAAARVLEAESRVRSAHGGRLPALDLGFGGARNFVTASGPERRVYANDFRASGALSWQVDLFGRLHATERARAASWMASENDRLALAQTLVALVVRDRVALSVGLQRVALAEEVIASRQSTLEIVEGRYSRGVESTSAVDVRLARENLAAARAALPNLELGLERTGHGLDELLGRKPGAILGDEGFAAGFAVGLPVPPPPPPGLPARLIDRRPDLRAAAFRASAARADIDVAVANLWPDLVVSASGGFASDELDDLFDSGNLFGGLAADLAVRLFAGGSLRADIDAAGARFEAEGAEYAAAVLSAVREVEDALAGERLIRERLGFVRTQRDEAVLAEELARDRYGRGLESLLTVLETERRRRNADDLALLLTEAAWNARIDLHLALGGDWNLEVTR